MTTVVERDHGRVSDAATRVPMLVVPALVVSTVIHVLVVPDHVREWRWAGIFFIGLAAWQLGLAAGLLRSSHPRLLFVTVWSNVGVVCLYVWSRTAGLPFAPVHDAAAHAHESADYAARAAPGGIGNGVPVYPTGSQASTAEPVGALDLAATAAELLVVILVASVLSRGRRATFNVLAVLGGILVVLRLTDVLA